MLMETESLISRGFLRARLRQVLSELPPSVRPLKVIPVAYPVVKIGFQVRERSAWTLGLVERYLMEALRDFGPMSAAEVGTMLGLEEGVISRAADRMVDFGGPVCRESGKYAVKRGAEDNVPRKEITITRGFLFSGVTGRLVPIGLLDENQAWRVAPVSGNNRLRDAQGAEPAIRGWFNSNHGLIDGRGEIERLVRNGDARTKERLGIPVGLSAVGRRDPHADEVAWIPALIVVFAGGAFQIRAFMLDTSILLLEEAEAGIRWIECACQGLGPRDFAATYAMEGMSAQIDQIAPGAVLQKGPRLGELMLGIGEAAWPLKDLFGAEERSRNAWLSKVFTSGYWWDLSDYQPSYALVTITPADAATARLFWLLRGRQELLRLDEQKLRPNFDLHTWWAELQRKPLFTQQIGTTPLSLDELREAVDFTPDMALQEKFELLWKQSRLKPWVPVSPPTKAPIFSPTSTLLLNKSPVDCIGMKFAQLAEASTSEIRVISPLVDHPEVIDSLIRARRRKLSVQVITELLERQKDSVSFPNQGFGFGEHEDTLSDHFAATRQLALNHVRCRCPRFCPHAKLWLFDGVKAVVTSANLSHNSLGRGENPAIEAGIIIEDEAVVSELTRGFEHLWQTCPYKQQLSYSNISLSEEAQDKSPNEEKQISGNALLQIHWNIPPSCNDLLKKIVSEIDSATSILLISALSLYDTKEVPSLHSALIKALHRGVKVTMVVRHDGFPRQKYPDPSTTDLLRHGLRLVTRRQLHLKAMLVDERQVGLFSANFNPYSLNTARRSAHIELGIFGPANGVLAGVAAFLKNTAESPEYEYRTKIV